MDMLLQTAMIKYHLQAHQHTAEITPPVGMIDPHLGIIATPDVPTVIIEIGTGSFVPDPAHTTLDTGVTATITPTGSTPDHFMDLHIVALHATEAQVHTATAMTHHIADPHPIEISPEMTADPGPLITTHMAYFLTNDSTPKGRDPNINIIDGIHKIKDRTSVNILVSNYTNEHLTFHKGEYIGHLEPAVLYSTDQRDIHHTNSVTLKKMMS